MTDLGYIHMLQLNKTMCLTTKCGGDKIKR